MGPPRHPLAERRAVVWLAAALLLAGCHRLDEGECLRLRERAFEVANRSHPCRDDADCERATWPGCPMPLNSEARADLAELERRFVAGGCSEPAASCGEKPEVYCDRQFCVFHHRGKLPDR
jgi:hypothetical protein